MCKNIKIHMKKIGKVLEKMFKILIGTQNNILLKFKLTLPVSATLIYTFAVIFQEESNPKAANVFKIISGIFLAICFVLVQNDASIMGFIDGFVRLVSVLIIFIYSLNFCVNTNLNLHGFRLVIYSIFACLGLFFCIFYFISKFIDIYNFAKNLLKQIKEKLFGSTKPSTSKIKELIENITAMLIAIGGLALAIKAIIEPLVNIFK